MKILEEFWYGNLDPAEYDTSPSPEYKELLQLISRNKEKHHDGHTERPVLPLPGLCTGIPGYGRMSAVSEQLLFGSQNDDGDL